jgi:hypothetical protein
MAVGKYVLRRMVLTERAACIWKLRHNTILYPQNLKVKTNHLRRYWLNNIANIVMSFKEVETGDVV